MPTHDAYDDLFRDPPTGGASAAANLTLRATQERTLIRPHGSKRHIVFTVAAPPVERPARRPLTLALVLDRSGSMSGRPLEMAKAVATRLVNDLAPDDQIAVVAFDDKMTTLHPLAAATADVKATIAAALREIDPGGSTALHEGWLTGCNLIVGERVDYTRVAHVLLLTDGLANVGLTNAREIAAQVAELRALCNVGTDTYGLGEDYDQALLGPMAMAGEGQFTHLRTPGDLEGAFRGVVENLRLSRATCVRLQIAADPTIQAKVISAYWQRDEPEAEARWSVGLGELAGGEERRVVVRFTFPGRDDAPQRTVRARLVWKDARGDDQATAWRDARFTYASDEACTEEARDAVAMRWIGLEYAARAKTRASVLSDAGDPHAAATTVGAMSRRMATYAQGDATLNAEMDELDALMADLIAGKISKAESKEAYFQSQRRSRGQKDTRGGSEQ
ncbi:MAG: vWA domain-containing protein [Ktedonobacterales bacterium]